MNERKRWRLGFSEKDRKNHIKEVMNKENDWEHMTAASMVEGAIKNVTCKEIAIAIKVMKPGKAAGPSEVCAENTSGIQICGLWLYLF